MQAEIEGEGENVVVLAVDVAKTGGGSAVDVATAKTGEDSSLTRPRRIKALSIAIFMAFFIAFSKNVFKKASCLAEKQSFSAIFRNRPKVKSKILKASKTYGRMCNLGVNC